MIKRPLQIFALLLIAIVGSFVWYCNSDNITNNYILVPAKITRVEKAAKSGYRLHFKYTVNGTEFTQVTTSYLHPDCLEKFEGKTIFTACKPDNPESFRLIIYDYDFRDYMKTCPDSLKWMLECS